MTWTIGTILNWTRQYFMDKGVGNPRLDAEVLLSHILCKDRLYLYVNFDKPLLVNELAAFREAVKKRVMRLPVAYITGSKEFMGLEFMVNEAVLIPRPDTEILVEAAIALLAELKTPDLLDLGTGSGAIIVSVIKKISTAIGIGVDISRSALEVASANAVKHEVAKNITFLCGDLWQPVVSKKFDAILSNPPYIIEGEIELLQAEVKREPYGALAGGSDGLEFYRRLVKEGHLYLKEKGFMALETGAGQAAAVSKLAEKSLLKTKKIIKDYSGIERVVILRLR